MDEFADQFFSSSSWIEDNTPDQGSYWVGGGLNQTNGVVDSAIEANEGYGKNLPTNLVASSDIVDSFITDDASMFVGGDSGYGFDNNIITTESQPLIDHGSSNSLLGLVDANLLPNYGNQQPELFHVDIDPISSPSVQPESGSVGSNESESSVVQHTLSDPPAFPTLPPVWDPSSYGGVSSLCNVIEQNRQQGIELLEQYVDANAIGNSSFMDGDILQDSLPTLFPDQHELNNQHVSSFSVEHQIPLGISADIQPQMQLTEGNSSKYYRDQSPVPQLPQAPVTSVGGCNGVVKPRVRARRGQATDPHSIAERLRREKIAERMKSLQELVPNSNKTDKASMLDEMIDYVKLLQLQVKALSMSKLGAAEVANPLIPHGHAKGSSGLFLPQPAGRGVDPFDSSNGMGALEQEVVKLMESDMAAAKQFLDTKGLSLMPLALASAISSTKASLCSTSGEETKSIMANGGVHHKLSSDGGTRSKGNKTGINSSRERVPNHCNGKNIKREEIFNTEKA